VRAGIKFGTALIAATLAFAALLAPGASAAAKTETQPAEETLEVNLQHDAHGHEFEGRHVLELRVYPLRGVAVAVTLSNNFDFENHNQVTYVEQIPKGPFDGYLDVHFKGLGTFAGEFVPKESQSEGHVPKGCKGPRPWSAAGSLVGSVAFRGAGGYARWSASTARAYLQRSSPLTCRRGAAEHERKPKTLFGYAQIGPGYFNHWRYELRARRGTRGRLVYFALAEFEGKKPIVDFDAGVYETLPGGIDVSRAVDRSVRRGSRLQASQGDFRVRRATLRPPPPFSGVGRYSLATRRLKGTIAVEFPGLKLRLGSDETVAELVDEYAPPEKSSAALDGAR
jgi:hypothetical protein